MPLALDENSARYQIRAYQPGFIQVNELIFNHSILIAPDKLITDWPPQTLSELQTRHFHLIIEWHPSVFLLGTGSMMQFPLATIYAALLQLKIGVEIMSTRAACMTYNALTAEGREVAAGLMV